MPPCALTSLAHSSYPFSNAWPSAEKSFAAVPVRDSDAPMVIGPVGLPAAEVVLTFELLLQAPRKPAARTATALSAIGFPGDQ